MLNGMAEPATRNTPLMPKAPVGACLIHSKPASHIGPDDAVYNRIEAPDPTRREAAYILAGETVR